MLNIDDKKWARGRNELCCGCGKSYSDCICKVEKRKYKDWRTKESTLPIGLRRPTRERHQWTVLDRVYQFRNIFIGQTISEGCARFKSHKLLEQSAKGR